MQPDDATLLSLAEAVADGTDIDWDHVEASADGPDERHVIRQLRMLAEVRAAAARPPATWGTLQIRNEVGRGTFGTVYRAWDARLEREVALKLLHTGHTVDDLASTVVKEARLLAQVRHPNVVTVYGADVIDGQVGIWTEFVNGRTLRDIVREQGPFGAYEAALIGRDLCRALAAVHKLGFLHRDIKAQNVMREAGGRTVLMDFGAGDASALGASLPLAGTPAYLAPEVLAGARPDARSDLYGLGVLLFHLVSGEFPVTGRSLDELRDNLARGRRNHLLDLRPDLPSGFVRVVDRALAEDPDERPESAGAMETLLEGALGLVTDSPGSWRRRVAYGAAVMTFVGAIGAATAKPFWKPEPPLRRTSVAILPFTNLSADSENDYFSAGVTADIASHLTRLRELRVITGRSALRYTRGEKSISEIASELDVAAVVHGTVRRSGDRVRVVSQLVDGRTGEQLWSDSFDRKITDIFQIQSEVSRKIAIALKGELSVAEAGWLAPKAGENFEAFNLYLKGRYQWSLRSEEGFRRSLQHYQEAIARYPDYAPAYAGLADTLSQMAAAGLMPAADAASRASAAASKAISLDGDLAEAHASLGYVQKNRFEWTAAEASFRRSIALKPGYAPAHHWYSILLAQHGRFGEALAEIKTAVAHDPWSISANAQLGTVLLLARRYDEAITQYENVLHMDPSYFAAHQVIGEAYCYRGDYERALASYRRAASVGAPGRENYEHQADLGYALARSGNRDEAARVLADLLRREAMTPHGIAANIATVYAALEDRDRAMHWLSIAVNRRDPEIGYLKVDPRWDALREDQRFQTMLAELGLAAGDVIRSAR